MAARTAGLSIRLACASDLEAVTLLRSELRREERQIALDVADEDGGKVRALTRRQLSGPNQVFLLAEWEEVPVGMLRVALWSTLDGTGVATLTTAYVRPSHRRRGIMRQLVDAAVAWCRDRGVTDLRLRNHVRNTEASRTWESLGFDVVQVVRRRVLPH